ncbi:MAG: hypothetical protein ACI4G0_03960 [Ruminococcus sp.]
MKIKKQKNMFWISTLGFFVMSLSLLFMYQDILYIGMPIREVIASIVFWVMLLIGILVQIMLYISMRESIKSDFATKKRKIGLICFFSNRYAAVADLLMIVSMIILIISFILTDASNYFNYIILSVFVFSFSMHCVLNGRKFYYMIHNKYFKECRN